MRSNDIFKIEVVERTNGNFIDLRGDSIFTTTVLIPGIGNTQTGMTRKMNSMIHHCKWK